MKVSIEPMNNKNNKSRVTADDPTPDRQPTVSNRPPGPVQPVGSIEPITERTAQRHEVIEHPKAPTKEQRKARVEAYLKLVQLGAAPSITFDAHHDALYQEVYAEAVKNVEQERYDEIVKNRKILDLGTAWDQMNVNETGAAKSKRMHEDSRIDEGALVIGGDNRVRTPEHHAEVAPSGYAGTKSVDDSTVPGDEKDARNSNSRKGGVMTTKNFGL